MSANNVGNDEHGDSLAIYGLCQRATDVTSDYYVTQPEIAQAVANAQLGVPATTTLSISSDRGVFQVETIGRVQLDVAEKDRTVTDDFLAMQRDEQARIERQDMQLRALVNLFAEPGLARLWWAERYPALLTALTDGTFQEVLEHLPRRLPDEPGTYAEILTRFINSLDEDGQQLALRVFETVLNKSNSGDLVGDLHRLRGIAENS